MDGNYAEQVLMDFAERTKVQLVGHSQIPLYHQLARVLQKFIQNDFLRAGDRFPSEEAVGACFNVSRPTVNKAIQELLADGWLNRVRGRGTFVNKDPHIQLSLLNDKLSLVEQFPLHKFRYRLIRKRIEPPIPRINQILGLKLDEPLLYLRRLRLMDDQPLLVCDSILPAERFSGLGDHPFVNGSLYATLDQEYACPVLRSERSVEASEVVEREVAALLNVPLLSPILLLTGIAFTEGDEPIEYIQSYLREGVSLKSTVQRGESHS